MRFWRDKFRVIGGLVTPLLYLIIMGVGLGSAFKIEGDNSSYLAYLTPGIIGMSLLFTSIFTGISVIFEKQFGFLKEMLVSPVSRASIALGKIAGSATVSLISAVILLALVLVVGIIPFSLALIPALILTLFIMALIAIIFVSIGLSLAALMDSMEGFQFVMTFLVMPMFLLSGVFFPLNKTPEWMQLISHVDPLMYGVDALRSALLGTSIFPLHVTLIVLGVFAIIASFVTVRVFERIKL